MTKSIFYKKAKQTAEKLEIDLDAKWIGTTTLFWYNKITSLYFLPF